jgi:hypothetical protein
VVARRAGGCAGDAEVAGTIAVLAGSLGAVCAVIGARSDQPTKAAANIAAARARPVIQRGRDGSAERGSIRAAS